MESAFSIQTASGSRLIGIRHRAVKRTRRSGILVLNSGIVHRIGPNRISVDLCRRLSSDGYECLRFDMSGLGDSPDAGPGASWELLAPTEISAVSAEMKESGRSETILFGNCGGAAKGFMAAETDPLMKGIIFTNPPPHPNTASSVRWETGQRLLRLFDRGVYGLFVFAEGDPGLTFYNEVLAEPLTNHVASKRLEVAIVKNTNHTFATTPAKHRVLDLVSEWLKRQFPHYEK